MAEAHGLRDEEKEVVEQNELFRQSKESNDGAHQDPEKGLASIAATTEHSRSSEIDPVVQRRVLRKLDFHLVPLVMVLYMMAFLDRSNIGNAKTAGMNKALRLDDAQYQWLLTMFYIGYILFEPLSLMWKIVPPHIWAFGAVMTWGLAASLQAAAYTWASLMVCRFFMAAAEASYGPGIPYLLSFFYMRTELGVRIGIFLSAAPLSTCFAGALAYGITSGHSKLENWRLLFLVEGLPTILLAFVAFYFLPDSPDKAHFLTDEEREVAEKRAMRQVGTKGHERIGGISGKDIWLALTDVKNWLTALMYFSCNVSFASLPVFTPTILNEMGFSSINAQGLSAPPYFLSFLLCILSTRIADLTRQRALTIIILSLTALVGYVLLASPHTSVGVRYFGIYLAAAGVFPAIANILPWVLNNQGSDTRRGMGIVMLNVVGQCGPVLGTRLFPESEAPRYVRGMGVCAGFMEFNALLAGTLRVYLAWENRRAERREEGTGGLAGEDGDGMVGVENSGVGFRNIL